MKNSEILTKTEYTKIRTARELREFIVQKRKEIKKHDFGTRKERYKEYGKGLLYKFEHELVPFCYYATKFYDDKPEVRLNPCCGSEPYDGIICEGEDSKVFVEITEAIDGRKRALQEEQLIENGHAKWALSIIGVKNNKTKRNRSTDDIITNDELVSHSDLISEQRKLVKNACQAKCEKSMKEKLPYGEQKTVLIMTFDDTGFQKEDRGDFGIFKEKELDSMNHKFKEIIVFGWSPINEGKWLE